MSGTPHIGRFLLPSLLAFETRDTGMYASGKMLPFILEELISRGISQILIKDRWRYENVLAELPAIFSKALHFVDDKEHRELSMKIFAPGFEEFGITTDKNLGSFTRTKPEKPEDKKAVDALILICSELPIFLTAMKEKSHCHFDIPWTNGHLDSILEKSRSMEMRSNIAVLKGVLSQYQEISYGSLKAQVNTATEMTALFEALLENARYKSLSREVATLGSQNSAITKTTHNISRIAKEIANSKFAKGVIDFGSTVITTYTGVPLPKTELAETLMKDKYFPPAADISEPIFVAQTKMIDAYPEIDFLIPGRPRTEKSRKGGVNRRRPQK
ncbi:hypothetical protein RLW55_19635 [Hyphomicrobium sp. B1]|uniref:hypothetical protein n=1 Tax=Hyphomicrobium sp. B1 TaxID=3075651 RepID=UPI003C2D7D7D